MADIRWVTFPGDPLECRGLAWLDKNLPSLWRLPVDQASSLPDGVRKQMSFPSGARLRLCSDTTELRLRVQCLSGPSGFGLDVYVNDRFWGTATSSPEGEVVCFACANPEPKEVSLWLPMRHELQIEAFGIDSNAECGKPASFSREHPLVLYGSSIAQGVGAARPGMSYASILSRSMNIDLVNLGFGGAGKAEGHVTALVAQIEACCYLLDLGRSYGQQTSEAYTAMLAALRGAHPGTPIVCVTPIFSSREFYSDRYVDLACHTRTVVRESVGDRIARGDAFLYLVDGQTLLSPEECDGLGSDGAHPNDLGHSRIAERLQPIVEKALQAADA